MNNTKTKKIFSDEFIKACEDYFNKNDQRVWSNQTDLFREGYISHLGEFLLSIRGRAWKEEICKEEFDGIRFLYFENIGSRMKVHEIDKIDQLKEIYGWMDDHCKKEDKKLFDWMIHENTPIGGHYEHRNGTMVKIIP